MVSLLIVGPQLSLGFQNTLRVGMGPLKVQSPWAPQGEEAGCTPTMLGSATHLFTLSFKQHISIEYLLKEEVA